MSHRKINAALSTQLSGTSYTVAYENADFTTPATLYVMESYLPAATGHVGMETGSTDYYKGIYQVTIMAPKDQYKLDGYTAADSIAATFSRGTVMTYDGVTVRVEDVSIAPPLTDGDRFAIPVSIEWRSLQRG
jgi:hypothetical protein